jgi:hypothetical protein
MVDDRGTSLTLNGNRCRDAKSRATFHTEYIIPRSLPRAPRRGRVVHSGRSTTVAFAALSVRALVLPAGRRSARRQTQERRESGEALGHVSGLSATAEQETNGDPGYRSNADRFPRLITHVTIRRRERFLGVALRLFRTV